MISSLKPFRDVYSIRFTWIAFKKQIESNLWSCQLVETAEKNDFKQELGQHSTNFANLANVNKA